MPLALQGTIPQDLRAAASPTFVTTKLSGLTDNYIPVHTSDAVGLANSPIYTDGTGVVIGKASISADVVFEVYSASSYGQARLNTADATKFSILSFWEGATRLSDITQLNTNFGAVEPEVSNSLWIRSVVGDIRIFNHLSGDSRSGLVVSAGNNVGIKTAIFPATMVGGLAIGAGTAPTAVLADGIGAWVQDINAAAGKAGLHMVAESGTGALIVGGVLIKTDTGDPAQVHEGLFCINAFDNTFKVYADAAWRQLVTW